MTVCGRALSGCRSIIDGSTGGDREVATNAAVDILDMSKDVWLNEFR